LGLAGLVFGENRVMSHFNRNAKFSQIEIPGIIPLMTLPNTVLFPQAMIPMHIYEPRYKAMLEDIMPQSRFFALALQNKELSDVSGLVEPPHLTACVGMVRACQKNDDGSSNLILQGLVRVRIKRIIEEDPYRKVEISPLKTGNSDALSGNDAMMDIRNLIIERSDYFEELPPAFRHFIDSVQDMEAFVDVMSYTLCHDIIEKQSLLENLDASGRAKQLLDWLKRDIDKKALDKELQGNLSDDRIGLN